MKEIRSSSLHQFTDDYDSGMGEKYQSQSEGDIKMEESNGIRQRAIEVIFSAIDVVNCEKSNTSRLIKSEDTTLFGHGSGLDSFELVGLILSIESKVTEHFGVAVTLADERAMSERNSPFRSVSTMANYIVRLVEESKRG
jgi:hypothetical protein